MNGHVSKSDIKLKYIMIVNGYARIIESEFNLHIWKDISRLVLLFYAKPIVMNIKMIHNDNIKYILFDPIADSYASICNKIKNALHAVRDEIIFDVSGRFTRSNFDSWKWDPQYLFICNSISKMRRSKLYDLSADCSSITVTTGYGSLATSQTYVISSKNTNTFIANAYETTAEHHRKTHYFKQHESNTSLGMKEVLSTGHDNTD
eukprot:84346_1